MRRKHQHLSSNKKGQLTISLSQPLPSRSIRGHKDNNKFVGSNKQQQGDHRSTTDENLLCHQCRRNIGSTKGSGPNNYVFNCSVCSSSFHRDCLDFDPSTIELIHAVFDSVPWVCNECQDLARSARNKGKNVLKTKSNAASDLDAVNARLAILELTIQSLQQSLVTSSSLSPGNTQSSVPCQDAAQLHRTSRVCRPS